MLLSCDCFIKIGNVAETPKPTSEGISKVIEIYRLMSVTIWSKADGVLLNHDCFIDVGSAAKTLKPTLEGDSEVTKIYRVSRLII